MAPGPWPRAHGPGPMAPGPWPRGQGPGAKAPGHGPGPRPRGMAQGHGPGARPLGRGSGSLSISGAIPPQTLKGPPRGAQNPDFFRKTSVRRPFYFDFLRKTLISFKENKRSFYFLKMRSASYEENRGKTGVLQTSYEKNRCSGRLSEGL